ncbi:MAG: hypothetical protein ACTSWX_09385 [Promethearchaeota archaeon]
MPLQAKSNITAIKRTTNSRIIAPNSTPLLDSSKLFKTAEGTRHFCDLFRLYYNTPPRYTGIHNDQFPFEQLGGKLNNRNYLDLLFLSRKRTTLFLAQEISEKTSLGFRVRSYPHRGAIICT